MIFEDAHWTDPTSLEAFGRAVDRIKSLPVLLIVTFRPEFNAPWVGLPHVTAQTLNRLGEREAAAIVARLVGNKELPADVMTDIVERTDGIPLFVEEMTKAILEAEGEGCGPTDHRCVSRHLPGRSRQACTHLDGAARPARPRQRGGADRGRNWAAFSPCPAGCGSEQARERTQSELDRLIQSGLLFRQGVPPHATYQFKHALVQDAAYGTLLREPRRALHARIAETLESQFAEIAESQPKLLARHYTEAGQIEKAAGLWAKRGNGRLSVRRWSKRQRNSRAPSTRSRSCPPRPLCVVSRSSFRSPS